MVRWLRPALMSAMVLGLAGAAPVFAGQETEEEESDWVGSADLNFVFTGGNASARTFGLRNSLRRNWGDRSVLLEGGAIRASSTKTTRSAVGPSVTNFDLVKESTSRTTAENYFARGRYDYPLSGWALLYGGAGWTRNTFAGVASRYSAAAGIGNTWLDDDTVALQTDYAFTYTIQNEVIDDPATDDAFFGVRLSWSYRYQANETTAFESSLIADENLEDRSDFRIDLTNSMAVAVSGPLALKLSWQMLYDSRPGLVGVPLQYPFGNFTGQTALAKLNKLDHLYTLALVVNF